MEYLHTMIRVHDLDAALDFFMDGLGLKQVRRVDHEAGKFSLVFLATPNDFNKIDFDGDFSPVRSGVPTIELTYNWPDENGEVEKYGGGRNFGHLAFQCDDIYALCQHLSDKGVMINRPPRDGNMAFVRSPDGISVELLQKGKPLPAQAPWQDMPNTGSW